MSPFGEAPYYITAADAQLERGILAERVRAGMDRARREGKAPRKAGRDAKGGFEERWAEVLVRVVGRR